MATATLKQERTLGWEPGIGFIEPNQEKNQEERAVDAVMAVIGRQLEPRAVDEVLRTEYRCQTTYHNPGPAVYKSHLGFTLLPFAHPVTI